YSNLREGGVESRLVKLSRQLMIAHIMVLIVYGFWRSCWIYSFFWTQGDLMCRLFSVLQALPFHLWSNIVAAIAVDMLCCIGSPLTSYRNGATRVRYFIIFSWLGAIICAAPMAVVKREYKLSVDELGIIFNTSFDANFTGDYYQCTTNVDLPPWIVLWNSYFHVFTSFYGPLAVIIICYSTIGAILQKQMTSRRLIADGGNSIAARTSATKARFLRATIAIVCTYVLTWLPYQVLHVVQLVCGDDFECADNASKFNFLQAIIIASTCINPFLYNFGADRKNRNSGNASTFEANKATVVVSMPVHKNQATSETLTFLPPQRTRSAANLNGSV
ncbi:hypothetical protein PFISCL1PPCAC_26963, partial [Pristionchus fissidentatus]